MNASAHDVAAALRERLAGLGQKKLHKLLYYCQGHHLATFGQPLFSEHLLAWDMGPVVAALWRDERDGLPRPEPHVLGEAELNTVGYVVSRYGRMNAGDLERLSHSERPWIAGDERRRSGGSDRIELEWIQAFFAAADVGDEEGNAADDPVIAEWLAQTKPTATAEPGRDDIGALVARLTRG